MLSFPFSTPAVSSYALDVAGVVRRLTDAMPPRDVAAVLHAPFVSLDNRSPIDAIRAGDIARVHALIGGWSRR